MAIYEPILMKFETQVLIGLPCGKIIKAEVLTLIKLVATVILKNYQKSVIRPFGTDFDEFEAQVLIAGKTFDGNCLPETIWLSVKKTKTANINRKKWQSLSKDIVIGYGNSKTAKITLVREVWEESSLYEVNGDKLAQS